MPDFTAIRRAAVKAARDRYYATHTAKVLEKRRRWYEANAAHAKAYAKKYRQEHAARDHHGEPH